MMPEHRAIVVTMAPPNVVDETHFGDAAASLPTPEIGAACADRVIALHAKAASAANARRFIADPSMKPTLVQSGSTLPA